jgi:hypothetical protein
MYCLRRQIPSLPVVLELTGPAHTLPETATTSHKFFAHARQFKLESPEIDEVFATRFVKVSLEDNKILEEQQKMVDMDPGNFRVDISADAAGLQFRKLLKRQIDARA